MPQQLQLQLQNHYDKNELSLSRKPHNAPDLFQFS